MNSAVVLIFSILFLIPNSAHSARCSHNCYVFNIDDSKTPIVVTPNAFRPMGGHSEKLNTMCVAKISHRGEILIFSINDIFGKELAFSIRKGSELLASGNSSGDYGSISFYPKKIRFSCQR